MANPVNNRPNLNREKIINALPYISITVAYIVTGKLGLELASVQPNATAIWAPTGIAIATTLVLGYSALPAIFIGAFLTNLFTAGTVITSLGIAVGNTLEAFVAAYLIKHFADSNRIFDRPRDIFKFSLFAGFFAPVVSATVGVTTLALAGFAPWAGYWNVWSTWWVGDFGGALIIAPVLLIWFTYYKVNWDFYKAVRIGFLVMLLATLTYLSLSVSTGFMYFFTPILVWAAFRFSQRGIATAAFALTEVFLWATLHGIGPFAEAGMTLDRSLAFLQIAMVTTFITVLTLTAIIAEEKKATRALVASNEQVKREKAVDAAMLASMGEGLVVTDRTGAIILTNPQAQEMVGRSSEELIGRKYYECIPMQDEDGGTVSWRERPMNRAATTGKKVVSNPSGPTQYYVRKDGTRFPVSYTKTPVVLDGTIVGTIEVFRDVTKGKEIDQAKSDFVSLASHQLRTPLSIISMYSELLQRGSGAATNHDVNECRDYAHEIQEATKRMTDLINDLLNASRIDTQTLNVAAEPINLKKMMESVVDEMTAKIKGKKLKVRVDYGKGIPALDTDAQLFRVAVQNLMSNAVKYTPPGGKVSFKAALDKSDIVITVKDTGYGIPKGQQNEIFKKLFRADNARMIESEGTGLGLYITQSIIKRLGGEVSFRSKENRGSTFWLKLPVRRLTVSAPSPSE